MTATRNSYKLFGIGLFVMTFGCHWGHALTAAAVTTARVASAVAVTGAAVASTERSVERTSAAPGSRRAAAEGEAAGGLPCAQTCARGLTYVCAHETVVRGDRGEPVVLYSCD